MITLISLWVLSNGCTVNISLTVTIDYRIIADTLWRMYQAKYANKYAEQYVDKRGLKLK